MLNFNLQLFGGRGSGGGKGGGGNVQTEEAKQFNSYAVNTLRENGYQKAADAIRDIEKATPSEYTFTVTDVYGSSGGFEAYSENKSTKERVLLYVSTAVKSGDLRYKTAGNRSYSPITTRKSFSKVLDNLFR